MLIAGQFLCPLSSARRWATTSPNQYDQAGSGGCIDSDGLSPLSDVEGVEDDSVLSLMLQII
jgi:hypothetical protein